MGVAPAQIRLRWNSRQLDEGVGHASAETTARYVHLSSETLAAEFAAARAATGR
jgi:hypothetical protein